jgi:hypothetical protein
VAYVPRGMLRPFSRLFVKKLSPRLPRLSGRGQRALQHLSTSALEYLSTSARGLYTTVAQELRLLELCRWRWHVVLYGGDH